ncbi:MAG TPA: MFS transporter [Ktedonobacteraceae bacterium]
MPAYSSNTRKVPFSSDFWKFWLGQTISACGGSFSSFAIPLLIFKLTGSSLDLALSVSAAVLPYFFLGLVIGAWVDHINRKRLMLFTDLARALIIASLFFAAQTGILSVWWIFAVAFLNAALGIGFDAANFAAIPSLVSQDKLLAANGRILAGNSTANVIGPLIAGALIAVVPLPVLFLVDAVSFLASAASLALVRTSFQPSAQKSDPLAFAPGPAKQEAASSDGEQIQAGPFANSLENSQASNLFTSIKEGLRYVLSHRFLSWITLLLLLANFILPTTAIQLVPLAREWFAASDTQIGLLYAASSLGTVLCSLLAERIGRRWSAGTLILASILLDGLFTLLAVLTHWYWVLLFFWCLRGGADVLFSISSYSLTQREVPSQLLGRVITFIRLLTWPSASLGALLGGIAIERTGNIALIYAIIGLLSIGMTLAFSATPLARAGQAETRQPAE